MSMIRKPPASSATYARVPTTSTSAAFPGVSRPPRSVSADAGQAAPTKQRAIQLRRRVRMRGTPGAGLAKSYPMIRAGV